MILEIFSDPICPWCFIGKRRLDQALSTAAGEGVEVIWRAYQLYPGIPGSGMDKQEFARQRYGGRDQSTARLQLESTARECGIDMGFGRSNRMPNTLDAHRMLHRARSFGVQHQMADALFSDYFELGRDIGDRQVLVEAAVRQGLDEAASAAYLDSDDGSGEVRQELQRADAIGVTGVPCFIFAGKFALPGAQEASVIGQFIERAKVKAAETA